MTGQQLSPVRVRAAAVELAEADMSLIYPVEPEAVARRTRRLQMPLKS
ncbi:MAG: hypothetical protein H0W30_19110 [Gemmatimonadaceae bacterium]|nr:hypothetical protein [Gemmatimonadaceae bacterium]